MPVKRLARGPEESFRDLFGGTDFATDFSRLSWCELAPGATIPRVASGEFEDCLALLAGCVELRHGAGAVELESPVVAVIAPHED
jgi:hypothetical protein